MSAIAPPPRPTCPPDCHACGLRKTGAFTPVQPQVLDFIAGFRADTLVVQAGAKWSAASDGSWILAYPYGGSGGQSSMSIRAQVANITVDAFAIIPVGANGDITLSVAGATANGCYLRVIGYFM